ncbi:Cadmium-induced protein CadI [Paraburkholderia domus]|jgi:catechol 2,3-dioxygenase-like lactoylglutathione lyase family enzyme|uniref:Cadmium-induced protein CadI n=1 Tax=Paraburkholderia domus TaxID=2793075 RepID=A0A9N8QT28_9BURK|nr:ArsI/CadI family heavy metal resistance metalloenzyme [Paraburkholderia domus]MBK5048214.1 glyoxalase/bleomycin resistance/dioxygenase family protein [Burkholderia sp. R-70006]MBK5060443.1 glyoxalase/bleomycin resistance/dioxygenase family protein [Burkholderia sp. R-70199]MBK5085467.1 glyoxalase/bleomycin resistance/dioxygenase family protein [Burkholderia sp. R-69927]MBK5122049.1 glyoxalase/bleomycin resistance/dioxygenase family protein [Burkholderia sp. R-69980]MBK5164767.1 glyoxalase/b
MKRMHVHISVENLADSVRFYSALFDAPPVVAKDDYAKWMLNDPRVNFAISQRGQQIGVDHLGIQVESDEELAEMNARLDAAALPKETQTATACCYARSNKYWTVDPQGIAWETYHTLDSVPTFGESRAKPVEETRGACCAPIASNIVLRSRS